MRLFVALDVPDETRESLAELIARLKAKCPLAKWVRPDAMHVTLKFIGNTDDENLPAIRQALANIRDFAPVELRFRSLGFFPNERRPRVMWCGVETSPNTAQLAAEVDRALIPMGIEREARAFTPHLTLARFNSHELHQRSKTPAGLPEIIQAAGELASEDFGALHTSKFDLFESKLSPSGAQYTLLETFTFAEAAI
jgi:2'-5' RNA ligase